MASSTTSQYPLLEHLKSPTDHTFQEPLKRIHEGEDVTFFLTSKAYTDLMTFILQLNIAMFPRSNIPQPIELGPTVKRLKAMVLRLEGMIDEAPPDPGPRRFGNVSFRKWYQIAETHTDQLLRESLPEVPESSHIELSAYLLGSFGSAQRLDYGSGHELSFLAFLGCIWKLDGFVDSQSVEGQRSIVLEIFQPYLQLIRRLIQTYNLEPAGSHGVWGLDDHSFVPYIFGSAQLAPNIAEDGHIPAEGSLPGAPDPGDVTKTDAVERQRKINMYFDAIGFIYDVKKGPFWEHSPMLYDISGVRAGWAKINKGMIKMYNVEVLSKFPVVQHFPFGSLFRWETDPKAIPPSGSAHMASQPTAQASTRHHGPHFKAPESSGARTAAPTTAAPWATKLGSSANVPETQVPSTMPATRAPWAKAGPTAEASSSSSMPMPPTRAPWAKDR